MLCNKFDIIFINLQDFSILLVVNSDSILSVFQCKICLDNILRLGLRAFFNCKILSKFSTLFSIFFWFNFVSLFDSQWSVLIYTV